MSCSAPSEKPLPPLNGGEQRSCDIESKPSPGTQPTATSAMKRRLSHPRRKLFLVVFAAVCSFACVLVLAVAAEGASQDYLLQRDCYPNGLWRYTPGSTWRIMDSSYFFSPNLAFGSLSFTTVKVIDIVWDTVVGRGGQLILGYITYRVFNESLLYYMENHPTSYKLFTAVAFEPISLTALGALGKECLALDQSSWTRFLRWLTMLCMLLSTLYVLAFPTLMSAMTGYTTVDRAYIEDYDGNLIEFSKFSDIRYVIQDSSRIGPYDRPLLVAMDIYDRTLVEATEDYLERYTDNLAVADRSSEWVFPDGSTVQLDSPTLNITVPPESVWTYEGRQGSVYPWTYMLENGGCQPDRAYQWGFSYIFLFMMSIYNCVWTFIMCGMWIDTQRSSRMYKSGRRPGLLRSVMDLSYSIREELGEEAQCYSNDELEQRLNESDGAMLVELKEMRVSRTNTLEMLPDAARRKRRGWRTGSTF